MASPAFEEIVEDFAFLDDDEPRKISETQALRCAFGLVLEDTLSEQPNLVEEIP